MTLLPIITLPDPVLRQVSTPVERFDAELKRLAANMLETMYDAPGIGLAAVQVNVPKRLLVLDIGDETEDDEPDATAPAANPASREPVPKPVIRNPIVMVNPRILTLSDDRRVYEEGCLSLPDIRVDIERPAALTVAYQDLDGVPRELTTSGLLATAIQHEADHLDGRLIIDYLTSLKRDIIIRRFKKQARLT